VKILIFSFALLTLVAQECIANAASSEKSRPIQDCQTGREKDGCIGSLKYINGIVYIGKFKDNRPSKGIYYRGNFSLTKNASENTSKKVAVTPPAIYLYAENQVNSASIGEKGLPSEEVISTLCPVQTVPNVPREAISKKISGEVKAEIIIKDGEVKEIEFLSGPSVFFFAIVQAVMSYQCTVHSTSKRINQSFNFVVD
jgi:hypothetical protein